VFRAPARAPPQSLALMHSVLSEFATLPVGQLATRKASVHAEGKPVRPARLRLKQRSSQLSATKVSKDSSTYATSQPPRTEI
jgi:hypothetical protein